MTLPPGFGETMAAIEKRERELAAKAIARIEPYFTRAGWPVTDELRAVKSLRDLGEYLRFKVNLTPNEPQQPWRELFRALTDFSEKHRGSASPGTHLYSVLERFLRYGRYEDHQLVTSLLPSHPEVTAALKSIEEVRDEDLRLLEQSSY